MVLTAGTFNAPIVTFSLSGYFTLGALHSFPTRRSSDLFVGGQTFITIPASFTVNNLTINKNNNATLFFNSTRKLIITPTHTLHNITFSSNVGTRTIEGQSDIIIDPTFDGGNATLLISSN